MFYMRYTCGAALLLGLAAAGNAALAQETYKVGITGAITGPAAGTYAPTVDAARQYIEKLNKAGGVNGRQVTLVIQDDQGQASRAAANAKSLVAQDKVSLFVNMSLSATYAPAISEAQGAGTPLLFSGAICPREVYPTAQNHLFCTTSFAAGFDSRAALDYIIKTSGTKIKLGLVAMAIPVSRAEIDLTETVAKAAGMEVLEKQIIAPGTADYTPFATKILQGNPDWVYAWGPWVTQVRTFEALRRLGWNGNYIAAALPEAESELSRLKDPKLFVFGANAFFASSLPVHKEIVDIAKASNSAYPANQWTEGWIAGQTIEAALKAAGWPATPDKVNAAMESLKVDSKGFRGGLIEWTKDNHFRTKQFYRVHRWSTEKNAIDVAADWYSYDVKSP